MGEGAGAVIPSLEASLAIKLKVLCRLVVAVVDVGLCSVISVGIAGTCAALPGAGAQASGAGVVVGGAFVAGIAVVVVGGGLLR